ncbi:MAG: HlyD family secretion protein, partial [Candidatus Sericytochromatia bacterium]
MNFLKLSKRLFLSSIFAISLSCSSKSNLKTIQVNGNLEFTEIQVTSEVSGKIEKLLVEEGDSVKQGSELLLVNSDILKAQLLQAKANLKMSKAKLASLESGARIQEVKQAETMVKQAQDALFGAKKTVSNSDNIYEDRSQQKQLLDNAETQYETSKKQYEAYIDNVS